MCLIIACPPNHRPSEETIRASCFKNDDGSGIAWTTTKGLAWKKGIEEDELLAILEKIPSTEVVVIHNRLATVGGKSMELSHPFLVGMTVTPSEGELSKSKHGNPELLFHNGHWHDWKRELCPILAGYKRKMPSGKWSDSRALAVLVHILGRNYLNVSLDNQRVCILDSKGFQCFGDGWSKHEDCWVSNTHNLTLPKTYTYPAQTQAPLGFGTNSGVSRHDAKEQKEDAKRYAKHWQKLRDAYPAVIEAETKLLPVADKRAEAIQAAQDRRMEAEARFLAAHNPDGYLPLSDQAREDARAELESELATYYAELETGWVLPGMNEYGGEG